MHILMEIAWGPEEWWATHVGHGHVGHGHIGHRHHHGAISRHALIEDWFVAVSASMG